MIIVVNDNGRSYSPTIGGVADALATLRLRPGYENALLAVRQALHRAPVVGSALYDALHAIKKGLKDVLSPQGMFEDLGLKYVGPVDGHDIEALESALRRARSFGGPVIVHAVTTKGYGYPPAETDQIDAWHATGVFDPDSGTSPPQGRARRGPTRSPTSWCGSAPSAPTSSRSPPRCCTRPGWRPFAERFPERTFDVGIAEQHALTSAAGLGMAGLHPVVAIYATFLNRAFDQLLMDVALHRQPVTSCSTAPASPVRTAPRTTACGTCRSCPSCPACGWPRRATRPRCARRCARRSRSPTARRSCASRRARCRRTLPALERRGRVDVLRRSERPDVLLVAVGSMVPMCLAVAERAADHGIDVTVVDPRWVLPVPAELVDLAAGHRLVVTVEDGGRAGGVGSTLTRALQDRECDVPVRTVGPAAGRSSSTAAAGRCSPTSG